MTTHGPDLILQQINEALQDPEYVKAEIAEASLMAHERRLAERLTAHLLANRYVVEPPSISVGGTCYVVSATDPMTDQKFQITVRCVE